MSMFRKSYTQDKTLSFEECCEYFNNLEIPKNENVDIFNGEDVEISKDEDLDQIKREFLWDNPKISLDVFKQLVPDVISYNYKFDAYDKSLTLEKLEYILEVYPDIDRTTFEYRITFECAILNSTEINTITELYDSILLYYGEYFTEISVCFHKYLVGELGPKLAQHQLDNLVSILVTKIAGPGKIIKRALEKKCAPTYIKQLLEIFILNNVTTETITDICKKNFDEIQESSQLFKVFSEYIDVNILIQELVKKIPKELQDTLIICLENGADLLSLLKTKRQ
jgi:hypothetical protein